MINVICWVVVGVDMSLLACVLIRSKEFHWTLDFLVGIFGGVTGGLFSELFISPGAFYASSLNIPSLGTALIGAVAMLSLWRLVSRPVPSRVPQPPAIWERFDTPTKSFFPQDLSPEEILKELDFLWENDQISEATYRRVRARWEEKVDKSATLGGTPPVSNSSEAG